MRYAKIRIEHNLIRGAKPVLQAGILASSVLRVRTNCASGRNLRDDADGRGRTRAAV